jgi:hypothetical protein
MFVRRRIAATSALSVRRIAGALHRESAVVPGRCHSCFSGVIRVNIAPPVKPIGNWGLARLCIV